MWELGRQEVARKKRKMAGGDVCAVGPPHRGFLMATTLILRHFLLGHGVLL